MPVACIFRKPTLRDAVRCEARVRGVPRRRGPTVAPMRLRVWPAWPGGGADAPVCGRLGQAVAPMRLRVWLLAAMRLYVWEKEHIQVNCRQFWRQCT